MPANDTDREIDLSDFQGCSVKSVTLRVMTGRDSLAAAMRSVDPKGGPQPLMGFYHRSNLLADAIVRVDGQPVVTPYVQWEDWNTRTQGFIEAAYDKLNGITKAEMDRFLAKHGWMLAESPALSVPPT
jgi:hypothetical protein